MVMLQRFPVFPDNCKYSIIQQNMKKRTKKPLAYEIFKGIRKPMPPPTKVMGSSDKKRYDRRDKGWKKDEDKD